MPSKHFGRPLPDAVPERDSCVVRCYEEHLDGLGLCGGKTGSLTSTARHIAVWLSITEAGLDTFDVRLLDRFMRHACALHTLEGTDDIRKVSLWLGHQSLPTTEMYLRTDPAEKLDMLSE